MAKTAIDWTDYSWNPVTGCTPISPACDHCYALSIATRFAGTPSWPNGFRVTTHPERLEQPFHWRTPRRVFVCSAGDLFHEDVPEEFIARVFARMAAYRQHTFQILTKRPERMLDIVNLACRAVPEHWPLPNVHIGVTAENQEMWNRRVGVLRKIPAAVRFVSIEPMLSAIDMDMEPVAGIDFDIDGDAWPGGRLDRDRAIHWCIVGGETGPGARPMHPDWVRNVRQQCTLAGVPFFFKGWGEWLPRSQGDDPERLPQSFVAATPDDVLLNRPKEPINRVGKRKAGHLLDGQEHRQFPEVAA